MRRYFHAIVDIVRGGVHPREVALAACLGLLAGFVSGWNLTLAIVLLAVLLLNVPTKVFGEAWAFGTLLSWTMTPISFGLGRWLLEKSFFGRWLAGVSEQPLVILFDLDRYTLVGGAAVAALLALPVAWLASNATHLLQQKFALLQAAYQEQTSPTTNVLVRISCWLIFGDASKPQPATVPAQTRWLRPKGVMLSSGVLLPSVVLALVFGPGMAEKGIMEGLSLANQSEVNSGRVNLSLASGLLEIHDLQISDPGHPDRDRLRIGFVAAQLRPGPLLRGRLHVERLMAEDIKADVARQSRARPYGLSLPGFDPLAAGDSSNDNSDNSQAIDLDQYIGDWETLRARTARLQELLKKIEALAELNSRIAGDAPEQIAADVPLEYRAMRKLRYSFGRHAPAVWIERIGAKGLDPQLGLGPQATLEISNLSSAPRVTNRPTQVAIQSPELCMEILATLNLHQGQTRHELRFSSEGLDLAHLVRPKTSRPSMLIEQGALRLSGNGWADSKQFELALQLELRDFQVRMTGERRLAGLSPDIWNQGLAELDHLRADAVAYGRWSSPKLRIDTQQLVAQYKHQLRAAGEHLLVNAIDEQMARGEALVKEVLDKPLAQAQQTVEQSAARAEQAIDHTAAHTEAAIDKAEQQIAGAQQQAEQAVSQAQSQLAATADQLRGEASESGRMLQENAAAIQSLVNPQAASTAAVPRPNLPAATAAAIASRYSRYGPPNFNLGPEPSPTDTADPSRSNAAPPPGAQPDQSPATAQHPSTPGNRYGDRYGNRETATPGGLHYPDSLHVQQQPQAEMVAGTQGPLSPPAPAASAQQAPTAGVTQPWPGAGNRPASFEASPPARMELGYDVRAAQLQPPGFGAYGNTAVAGASPLGSVPAGNAHPNASASATPPARHDSPIITTPPSEQKGSRLGNWTRSVTGRVKRLVPWGDDDVEGGAEVTASDQPPLPAAAADNSTASSDSRNWPRSPAATGAIPYNREREPAIEQPASSTRWYQRFWR